MAFRCLYFHSFLRFTTRGLWWVGASRKRFNESHIHIGCTDIIPHPGRGAYILTHVGQRLHNFATIEFPPLDRHWTGERVDRSDRWTTLREPTARTPICFEWRILEEGQDFGWWAKIGYRLSLYNEDGRWTVQRLKSITSLVNKGLDEAIRREEEQPYDEDPYGIFSFDTFGDFGDGDY